MISLAAAIEVAACEQFFQPSKKSLTVRAPQDSAMTAEQETA